jgi:hypothetical protein
MRKNIQAKRHERKKEKREKSSMQKGMRKRREIKIAHVFLRENKKVRVMGKGVQTKV